MIGRWNTIDPLAEIDESSGPYTYVDNDPIALFDADGMQAGGDPNAYDNTDLQDYLAKEDAAAQRVHDEMEAEARKQKQAQQDASDAQKAMRDGTPVIPFGVNLPEVHITAWSQLVPKIQAEVYKTSLYKYLNGANQGVDWKGAGIATLGIVGGAAEGVVAAGTEWFSGGLSTPVSGYLAVDGTSRIGLNGVRLWKALRGDTHGRDIPSNLGEVPGYLTGSAKGQIIGGLLNDTFTTIFTGGTIGSAVMIFDSDATAGVKLLSFGAQMGAYSDLLGYGGAYGK